MAKSDPVADALLRLKACAVDPRSAGALAEVSHALTSKSNLPVARAAELITTAKISQFVDPLIVAFDRFLQKPTTTDKGCSAKTAIAKALYELEAPAQELFLRGIRHVQMEPVWGGQADTAADLRGYCALGLVRSNYRDAMTELGDLLMDAVPTARLMAARAIGYSENPAGAPLLRMKLIAGDANYDVTVECLSALLKLTPRAGVSFVGRFLDSSNEDIREAATYALGESRQPAAFDLLTARYAKELLVESRRPLLLAIAMPRLPASLDFLFRVIADDNPTTAAAAIEAMAISRLDDAVRAKLKAIIDERSDDSMRQAFEKAFV